MERLEKLIQGLIRNMPLTFGIVILTMDAIAFSAPIFAHLGLTDVASVIYRVYSFLCHQRPWRSIHIFDYQVAWCTRDTFIYLSIGLAGILVKLRKIRRVPWFLAVLSIIPIALDGGTQFIAEMQATLNDQLDFFYASTNFFRMLTGTIFGTGVGLWLFSMMDETIEEETSVKNEKFKMKNSKVRSWRSHYLFYYGLIIAICFISYLGIVQVWRITSSEYGPSGPLDHKRYFPGVNYEEVEGLGRGGHGV